MAMPDYNKDMYKPAHERTDPQSKLGKVINQKYIEQKRKFKNDTNRNAAKKAGRLAIETPIFVPLDPSEPINGKDGAKSNKAVTVALIFTGIWLFIMLFTFKWLTDTAHLPWYVVIPIQIILGVLMYTMIATKFVYKVDNARIEEARNRGNKALNLGAVWGINPGGIYEGRMMGRPHTTAYYSGKETIVLKVLKKSVLVSNSRADWIHYDSLTNLESTIVKNGYSYSKVNVAYNTKNDYIWDELDENLAQSSMIFGKEYSDLMTGFYSHLMKQTLAISKVSVVYYFIKPEDLRPEMKIADLALELANAVRDARCTLQPVSNKEFLRLFKDYYGVSYLDLEEISDHISAMEETPVSVSLLAYVNNEGELVKIREGYKPRMQNYYTQSEASKLKEKPFNEPTRIESPEKYSVFGDKLIKQ